MRARGFTLIEAIIGVAVMAFLMAAGMPMYTQWIQNAQIRTAADSIIDGLQLARNEAVRRGALVRFGLTGSSAWEVCLWNVVNNKCLATEPVIQTRSGGEGSSNASLGAGGFLALGTEYDYSTPLTAGLMIPGGVTFSPFGRPANTGVDIGRIDVRNTRLGAAEERRLVIAISLGGQIRLCDPKIVKAVNPQGC